MTDHAYVKPGQVGPEFPPPDQCVSCGQPRLAHDRTIMSDGLDIIRFRNWLAGYLTRAGGDVTDMGYYTANRTADLVVRAPDGHCIEVTMRVRG